MRADISWQEERAVIENSVTERSGGTGRVLSNDAGTILLARADHDDFAGIVESGPYCRIALLQSGGGLLRQRGDDLDLEEDWQPGAISLLLPRRSYEYEAPHTRFLGLAVDFDRHLGGCVPAMASTALEAAAGRLHHDRLIATVLEALAAEADVHGTSTAFFEHGIELIFSRLLELGGACIAATRSVAFSQAQLSKLVDYVEANLARDLTVTDLARQVGRDRTGFAKAFRQTMGRTPYEYLTQQRMRRAMMLMRRGEPVTAAAAAVGYANPSKFAAAFRRVTGASPREWIGRAQVVQGAERIRPAPLTD